MRADQIGLRNKSIKEIRMIKIQMLTGLVVVILLSFSMPGWSAEKPANRDLADENLAMLDSSDQAKNGTASLSIIECVRSIQGIDPKKWGIRNGCINSSRVKKIRFLDDQTAMLSLRGKKKAIMRLETACPGIKCSGFSRVKDSARLCRKFDRFNVLGGSFSCRVASIDPALEILAAFGIL
jgi:hypothetical protein